MKEILIDDIPEEGLSIAATEADAWLAGAVRQAIGEAFDDGGHAELAVDINKIERNVNIDGTISIRCRQECDRCLVGFDEVSSIRFHAVLAPLYESKRQQEREEWFEKELVKEDLEFGYYEGDRFDLDEVVREQIVLNQPMKHLCREDCKGLCQTCGKNLNEGPCGCSGHDKRGSFDALRNLKIGEH